MAATKRNYISKIYHFKTYKEFVRKFPKYKNDLWPVLADYSGMFDESIVEQITNDNDDGVIYRPLKPFIVEFIHTGFGLDPCFILIPNGIKDIKSFIKGYEISSYINRKYNNGRG